MMDLEECVNVFFKKDFNFLFIVLIIKKNNKSISHFNNGPDQCNNGPNILTIVQIF
jgi:hypothetical protein